MQRFVHEDGTSHYFTLRDEPKCTTSLMRHLRASTSWPTTPTARAATSCMARGPALWAIDNGLCFNSRRHKLRTVIWDFGEAPLEGEVQEDSGRLAHDGPPAALCVLIEPDEVVRHAWTGWHGFSACAPCPSWSTTGDWPPYPWPLV